MKIVRVNMTTASITEEEFIQKDWWYYGGRGLIDIVIDKEMDPLCDPLGPDNMVIFATGYFCGTAMTTSGRISVGGKSPLTGGIKESNAGGTLARAMSDQGIKMIIITGKAEDGKEYYLYVDKKGKITLEEASEFKMMLNYELGDKLREKHGENLAIASIGPGGERLSPVAAIMVTEFKTNHPCRAAARGGMGAVMGSKGVKAVVIDSKPDEPCKVEIPEEYRDEFMDCVKRVSKAITENPMSGQIQPKFGSAAGVGVTGKLGALPYNNFSGKKAPEYEKLASDSWYAALTGQGGRGTMPCQPGCIVRCSNEYHGKDGKYISAGIEYETLALCGSNLGIFEPDFVATADRFCDDYGIDTIDIGAAIGVAMDCGVAEFGDQEAALKMLHSIADENSEFGNVLLRGCQATGEYLNAKRIPTGKRQALAAYDPRVLPGFGMTFERSPMGADHTSGSAVKNPDLSPEDRVDTAEAATAACDNYVCLFAWGSINPSPDAKAALTRAAGCLAGEPEGPGPELVQEIGRKMLHMEHTFNKKNGFTIKDDRLGEFFYTEPAEATGVVFDSGLKRSFLEIEEERMAEKS